MSEEAQVEFVRALNLSIIEEGCTGCRGAVLLTSSGLYHCRDCNIILAQAPSGELIAPTAETSE